MNLKTWKACVLATMLLVPMCSFAQEDKKDTRVEVNFKQRHSKPAQDLYADGIKIKRDLSLIKEAQEERILDMDEIPADELYGGVWSNKYVNVYGGLENTPDIYDIDLSNFSMPHDGYVTSNYGPRRRRMHRGIDLKVQEGDTIYAAFDGKVRMAQYEGRGYGYYITLRHPNGLETIYGHLSKFLVSENDVVKSGDPIGLGGNTGRSTGSHLHLEFRFLGKAINPIHIVDFDNKICHREKYVVNVANLDNMNAGRITANTNSRSSDKISNKYATGTVAYYRIKSGDNLGKIARENGISIQKLCQLNNISTKEKLRVGKTLRVS